MLKRFKKFFKGLDSNMPVGIPSPLKQPVKTNEVLIFVKDGYVTDVISKQHLSIKVIDLDYELDLASKVIMNGLETKADQYTFYPIARP